MCTYHLMLPRIGCNVEWSAVTLDTAMAGELSVSLNTSALENASPLQVACK